MVNTGIKEYDNLPGRYGLIDVDVLRFAFNRVSKEKRTIQNHLEQLVIEYSKDTPNLPYTPKENHE